MNIIISNSGEKPIYEQIEDEIKRAILSGDLKEGDALPSMRLLAKELRVSVITTKRAYNDLEQEGYISTVPGKGSFVQGGNENLMREKKMRDLEDIVERLVTEAKILSLSESDLTELIRIYFGGE